MSKGMWLGCGIVGAIGVLICAGVVALVSFGVFGLLEFTKPVAQGAEDFLGLLGQGKTAEAYAGAAAGLRATQDEASFTNAVNQLGLSDYSSVSWHSRNRTNQEGTVEGTVTTKKGASFPVTVHVVEEDGKWRVAGLRASGADLTSIKK
jgi:hypothetical protein